jgi:hypothetical protein
MYVIQCSVEISRFRVSPECLNSDVYEHPLVEGYELPLLPTWIACKRGISVRIACQSEPCQSNYDVAISFTYSSVKREITTLEVMPREDTSHFSSETLHAECWNSSDASPATSVI